MEQDGHEEGHENGFGEEPVRSIELPEDLPRTLDDRRTFNFPAEETEIYDAWQGTTATCAQDLMKCC